MDDECIPQDWKTADVSPIFKNGARKKAENHRPLSLTSIVCRLVESFVKESIAINMKAENLFSTKQYDFIKRRSNMTELLSYLDKCIDTIVTGGVAVTIYVNSNRTPLMGRS